MRNLVKQALKLDPSMVDGVPLTWRELLVRRKLVKYGFLCRFYDADEALNMGLVNTVVPLGAVGERNRPLVQRNSAT